MSMFNKIAVLGLSTLCAFSIISTASAAPEPEKKAEETSEAGAILFRIENIKPIQNEEGLINKCTFVVTAFNRMNKAVREATLNFKWVDNISGKYTVSGQEIKVNKGAAATTVVTTEVTLTDIAPHRQKSFEASVDTDKCFLLFDNLDYTVSSCANEGDKVESKKSGNRSRNAGSSSQGCAGNFDYIDSQNPEYYSEFQDVPESVLAKQAEDEKAAEVQKINESYRGAMNDLREAGNTLADIK